MKKKLLLLLSFILTTGILVRFSNNKDMTISNLENGYKMLVKDSFEGNSQSVDDIKNSFSKFDYKKGEPYTQNIYGKDSKEITFSYHIFKNKNESIELTYDNTNKKVAAILYQSNDEDEQKESKYIINKDLAFVSAVSNDVNKVFKISSISSSFDKQVKLSKNAQEFISDKSISNYLAAAEKIKNKDNLSLEQFESILGSKYSEKESKGANTTYFFDKYNLMAKDNKFRGINYNYYNDSFNIFIATFYNNDNKLITNNGLSIYNNDANLDTYFNLIDLYFN